MTEGIDEGLNELVADQLGPADATAETPTETAQPAESQEASPASEQPEQVAEAQQAQPDQPGAPTAPTQPAEQTVEINGQKYTLAQVQAAFTTAQQFPHLQKLREKERAEWAQQQQQWQQQQQRPAQQLDPKTVQRQIRASFDQQVDSAVKDGFMEPDFAALYPDVAAGMVMYRDTLTAVASVATQLQNKVSQYEQQIAGERIVNEVKNNMAALSGQHAAFQPLADPTVRDQFFEYLVQVDPKVDQLQDPQFLIGHWVAFKRNDFLQQAPAQARVAQQVAATRQVQRRQAVADAVGGSRPAAIPTGPKTALDEMVDEMFDRSR